jgi:RNA polymerase sigma factor (sigma-70 family)
MSPLAISIRFLQTQPDERLLALARDGHERAFEALIQRYRRQLLKYCRRLTSSDATAEDILQQALLQAWIALSAGETDVRDPRAWLYRIVHNVAISNLRRPAHEQVAIERGLGAGGADHEVERRLAVREALAGLASLPELQRQVILSTAFEGRSHDEVAAALGLSHGAVRGLIYRARATLRAAAAAVTPSPLIQWALRQSPATGGRSAAVLEAVAGTGSAGLGGVLLKGGAVVAAGAIATAAGISASHVAHPSNRHAHAALAGHAAGRAGAVAGPAAGAAAGGSSTVALVALSGPAGRSTPAGGAGAGASGNGAVLGGPGSVRGSRGPGSGGGGRGGNGSSGPGRGSEPSRSGHGDGSSGSGGSDGSGGGSGSPGGSDGSGKSGPGGPSGGDHSGGSDGGGTSGGSSGSSSSTTATASTDGSDHSDGGGDHSGSGSGDAMSSGSRSGGGTDGHDGGSSGGSSGTGDSSGPGGGTTTSGTTTVSGH